MEKEKTLEVVLEDCPQNQVVVNNLIKAWSKINNPLYNAIVCSISGGADSDLVLDICERVKKEDKNIIYVCFDTGLEYQATKEHLKHLENRYGVKIQIYKAKKTIPICCKQYGQPFLSKQVSEYIQRLQKHNFQWEDESYDVLINKYPRCSVALKWWCCKWGDKSKFNITYNKWLKEFMVLHPPTFLISNKCCYYAKKVIAKQVNKDFDCDLNITGVRRSEGGARASAYKSCFSSGAHDGIDTYRPIFFYTDHDKKIYDEYYKISHSRCYTEYGLKRTGCAGCPYGRDFEYELEVIQKYEPKLYTAVNNIFKDSYDYTRKYREFCKEMNEKNR